METRRGHAKSTHDLVPDTLATLDAFGELSDAAFRVVARAEALRQEWAVVMAENHLCEWGQEPGDLALFEELSGWIKRVQVLTARAAVTAPRGHDPTAATDPTVEDYRPGYFVG